MTLKFCLHSILSLSWISYQQNILLTQCFRDWLYLNVNAHDAKQQKHERTVYFWHGYDWTGEIAEVWKIHTRTFFFFLLNLTTIINLCDFFIWCVYSFSHQSSSWKHRNVCEKWDVTRGTQIKPTQTETEHLKLHIYNNPSSGSNQRPWSCEKAMLHASLNWIILAKYSLNWTLFQDCFSHWLFHLFPSDLL